VLFFTSRYSNECGLGASSCCRLTHAIIVRVPSQARDPCVAKKAVRAARSPVRSLVRAGASESGSSRPLQCSGAPALPIRWLHYGSTKTWNHPIRGWTVPLSHHCNLVQRHSKLSTTKWLYRLCQVSIAETEG
jgi:hypothetical protein